MTTMAQINLMTPYRLFCLLMSKVKGKLLIKFVISKAIPCGNRDNRQIRVSLLVVKT